MARGNVLVPIQSCAAVTLKIYIKALTFQRETKQKLRKNLLRFWWNFLSEDVMTMLHS